MPNRKEIVLSVSKGNTGAILVRIRRSNIASVLIDLHICTVCLVVRSQGKTLLIGTGPKRCVLPVLINRLQAENIDIVLSDAGIVLIIREASVSSRTRENKSVFHCDINITLKLVCPDFSKLDLIAYFQAVFIDISSCRLCIL